MDIPSMALVGAFILMIPLWILYHKIFSVFYFNLTKGILAELASSLITGYLISAIFLYLIRGAASAAGKILSIVIQAALVSVTVYFYAVFIWAYRKRKKRRKAGEDGSNTSNEAASSGMFATTWHLMKKRSPYSFIVVICVMLLGTMKLFYMIP